jgi:ABC-type Zn uptake system ZnuABC Zn-binding protein ZnuA
MVERVKGAWLCLFLFLLAALIPSPACGEISVVAGIDPVASLVKEIAGEGIRVIRLYPPGASPRSAEASREALRESAGALLYFRAGRWLEGRDEKRVTEAAGPLLSIVDLSGNLDLIALSKPEETERKIFTSALGLDEASVPAEKNPYFWLDPTLAEKAATTIAARLAEIAPGEADALRERSRRLRERLAELNREIQERLEPVEKRRMAVFTGAASYFARRYTIAEIPVTGVTPGGGPGRQSLKGTVERLRSLGVSSVFTDPSFPRRPAESAAAKAGVTLLTLHPFGTPEHRGYFDMMRLNLSIIEEGSR